MDTDERRFDFVFDDEGIITMTRIITDGDEEGALAYFKDRLSRNTRLPGSRKRLDIVIRGLLFDELLATVRNNDARACLDFIKDNFAREIKNALIPHCVPVFEVSYKPNQAEGFSSGKAR
jgi:hypothetical protein